VHFFFFYKNKKTYFISRCTCMFDIEDVENFMFLKFH